MTGSNFFDDHPHSVVDFKYNKDSMSLGEYFSQTLTPRHHLLLRPYSEAFRLQVILKLHLKAKGRNELD